MLLYLYWASTPENLQAAQDYAQRALALAPDRDETHVALGQVFSLKQQYDDAAREFEIALSKCAKSFDAHYYYARAAWAAGDFARAEEHFEAAAAVRPEDFQALSLLVSLYIGQGRTEEALATARRANERALKYLELYPSDPRALYMAAGQHALMGDKERAIEYGQRAISVDPTDAAVNYNVGCVYANLGEKDRALERLEAAVAHGFAHREWVLNDGDWAALREDSRFREVIASMP